MEFDQKVSPAEMHKIGVRAVAALLKSSGHDILTINLHPRTNPQIVARIGRRLAYVIVRTAVYPARGHLFSETVIRRLVAHAASHKAFCYFAGLGITHLDAGSPPELQGGAALSDGMAVQVEGVDYFISFSGLELLTTSCERTWQN